jgi:transposase
MRSVAGGAGHPIKLAETLAEETAKHAPLPVELWATDEHRLGLKPVQRRVWAPKGLRPIALGHHRFEWLYVTAFVAPESGETVWYLSNGIDKRLFEMMLAGFARETGAGRDRIILLLLDGAGWHTEPGLAVPEGIRLIYLPPYTPELQPAEHLWPLVDEPVANRHFDTLDVLDAVLAKRCRTLKQDRHLIAANTRFHWWPNLADAN